MPLPDSAIEASTPHTIVDIQTLNGGPLLRFSDQVINVDGDTYEDYLLDASGVGAEVRRATSEGLNPHVVLKFKNDRHRAYDYLIEIADTYPLEGAVVTISTAWFYQDTWWRTDVLYKGVLEEPRNIDLMSFTCAVTSLEFFRSDRYRPSVIDEDTYPDAVEDLGATLPFIIGSGVLVPAQRISWGARTTLTAAITAASNTISVTDSSRFPSAGSFYIDGERIAYTGNTGTSFTGCSRAQGGTTATVHGAGATAWEHKTNYDSVLSDHQLHTVSTIYAEIAGELYRVTSGVTGVYEGGVHKLRATAQVKVATIEEDLSVGNPNHAHTYTRSRTQFSTNLPDVYSSADCSTSSRSAYDYITFPSTSGKVSASYDIEFEVEYPASPCGTLTGIATVTIGGILVYKYDNGTVTVNKPSPLKFSQVPPVDSVQVLCDSSPNYPFGSRIRCSINSAERTVEVNESNQATAQATYRTGDIVATYLVDRFLATVSGAKDDGSGTYTGVADALIERPDHVFKWILLERLGFAIGDLSTASFTAAGALYAAAISGGYKFAFSCVRDDLLSTIRELALQCRSTLAYVNGLWKLTFIPDAAPAALRTIEAGEIAGQGAMMTFDRMPLDSIVNEVTAKFTRNYHPLGGDSEWDDVTVTTDATSAAKYGTYPMSVELWGIRSATMAQDVVDHLLIERKAPRLIARFTLFYEHADLQVGHTVQIENPLFDGRKFLIEQLRRSDQFHLAVQAREWWT